MRGWFAERRYSGAICMLAALLWLGCLASPAPAFWGDYGSEPPPEIFGVRLGDDIRNYEGMVRHTGRSYMPFRQLYQRNEEKRLTFGGVPLREDDPNFRPYYATYKNKICSIDFYVHPEDYERVVQKISAIFGPPLARRESPVGLEIEYVWMNSEVFVTSDRRGGFYIEWLPIQKKIYEYYVVKWSEPIAFEGVTLGGEAAEYPFLKEIYREGPDVIHYVSEKPLPYELDSCVFSAYKGKIYGLTLIFGNGRHGYRGEKYNALFMLGLPDDEDKYLHFWGDVQIDWLRSSTVYVRLTPAYWEADRAKIAYYRNVKPD